MRAALAAGEFEELAGRPLPRRSATSSSRTRCSSSAAARRAGRSRPATASRSRSTSRSTTSSLLEGEAYDLIHRVNTLRKEQGFELTRPDRPHGSGGDAQLVDAHGDWIKREVLAVEVALRRRARAREGLGRRALGAAQLDRQLEAHVLVHGRLLAHLGAARRVNHAQTSATRRSGADAPDVRPTVSRPSSQLSSIAPTSSTRCASTPAARATSTRRTRVRGVPRADDEQQIDLLEQLLHGPLAVRGRVTDVLARRLLDPREAAAEHRDDLVRLVDRKRRLRDVRERLVGRKRHALRILGRLDEDDRVGRLAERSLHLFVPGVADEDDARSRRSRSGAPARALSSRAGTWRRSSRGRARPPPFAPPARCRARRRRRSRPPGRSRARRRRSRRAPRGRARRASCGRSACGRRRGCRRAREPARPSRPPARRRRNSRAERRGGHASPLPATLRPRARKSPLLGGSAQRALPGASRENVKTRRGSHRPVDRRLRAVCGVDNGPYGPSL